MLMGTFLVILPNILVGVIVAIVTAYATVRLSIRQFRVEQWWSRKADAYTSIIEGMHDMKRLDEAYLQEYRRGSPMPKERQDELANKAQQGYQIMRRAIDARGFLLCHEAITVLEALDADLDRAHGAVAYYEGWEMGEHAIGKCLAVLPGIAKKDLGVG